MLSELFSFIYSNSKRVQKVQLFKGTNKSLPQNSLRSHFYDLESIQITIIYPWNTNNTTWYFYHILNSSESTYFDLFVSLYLFYCLDTTSLHGVSL